MVHVVTEVNEFQTLLKENNLVIVDFFATWCGPCKMIAPLLEKFQNEYSNIKFLKIDVDQLGSLAQEYNVSSMPTLILFKNGEKSIVSLVLTQLLLNKLWLLLLKKIV